jgi:Xaa-Pro aminopeptidase
MKQLIFLLAVVCGSISLAQEVPNDFLPSSFHEGRRQAVKDKLPENSVAVFFSNPIRNRSNDVDYVYHQDPNFYYLTGYREPHSLLLIFSDLQTDEEGKMYDEALFVQPRNPMMEMWTGRRLGSSGVIDSLKFTQVYENKNFQNFPLDFSKFDQVLFYDFQNDVRDTRTEGDLYDLISWFKDKANYPSESSVAIEPQATNLNTEDLQQIMNDLRGIKTPDEIKLLRKAVNISCVGQVEVMKAMKPGMSEREVQGIHEFVFKKYQAEYEGYPSIVGAGNNGCILHYIDNYKPSIESDEMMLMDLGAEYHGYTADVTRTIPVDGKFSPEEKAIYDLVYVAQDSAIKMCKPGVTFQELGMIARTIINQGLTELGITDAPTDRHLYYPHGLSHHIGLDVHDHGNYNELAENMVITIEPGIYIPSGSDCDEKWWGIAVRIEDDILITRDGFELLSAYAPRTSAAIEEMMSRQSALEDFILPDLDD